jgi:transcriptional regulator with XRE-family HTH domain
VTEHPGMPWVTLRAELKLSREKFAERVELTPGAIWRIEAKGKFKPGELEKLQEFAAVNSGLAPAEPPAPELPVATGIAVVPLPLTSVQDELSDDTFPIAGVTLPDGFTAPLPWVIAETNTTPVPTEPPVLNEPELTPFERFQQDGIRRYSNSEIQTFKRCRRKWFLAYYRQLTPKYTSPIGARAIGDRLHRALRWHYHGDPAQRLDVRDALEAIIQIDRKILVEHYTPDVVPLGIETKFNQEADLERVMIAGYVEWLAETGADSEYQVLGSEEYVEVDFTGGILKTPVKLVARLDARIRRIGDGARLFIDHKTVGNFEQPQRTLSINEQMLWYLMLERMLASPGERVDGAIYNMLRRCKRTPTAKPPFYHRVEVRHNIHEIDNFGVKTAGVIAEIDRLRTQLDEGMGLNHRHVAYPTPSQDCTWSCDFLPLENLIDDGSDWEGMAQAFFNVGGDPSAYYKKANDITIS